MRLAHYYSYIVDVQIENLKPENRLKPLIKGFFDSPQRPSAHPFRGIGLRH